MDLAFINHTGLPSKEKERSTRKQIRKHVMKDIGKSRRKPGRPYKQAPLKFTLEIPEIPQMGGYGMDNRQEFATQDRYTVANLENRPLEPNQSSAHQPPVDALIPHGQNEYLAYLPPIQRVWTGRMDPFIRYPIEMTHETLRLIDHVFDDRYRNTPPFRDAWFPLGVMDAACFHQVLSNAALNINSLRSTTNALESFESIVHHSKAVSLVKAQLDSPNRVITDGLVAAVVGFGCYRHGIGDLKGWRMHINAVKELMNLRGGIDQLNSNRLVRMVLFWIDLGGSSTSDTAPNFPLPTHFLSPETPWSISDPIPSSLQRISQIWRHRFPTNSNIIDIFESVSRFSSYLSKASVETRGAIYSQGEFAAMFLSPLAHQLVSLSSEYPVNMRDQGAVLQEVLRLSCILYLAEIRRLCGIMAVISTRQVQKLRSLLSIIKEDQSIWGNGFEGLRCWCFAMGGMEATSTEDRDWFWREFLQLPDVKAGDFDGVKNILWYFEAHESMFSAFLERRTDAEAKTHPHTRNWFKAEPAFLHFIESKDRTLGLETMFETSGHLQNSTGGV